MAVAVILSNGAGTFFCKESDGSFSQHKDMMQTIHTL